MNHLDKKRGKESAYKREMAKLWMRESVRGCKAAHQSFAEWYAERVEKQDKVIDSWFTKAS